MPTTIMRFIPVEGDVRDIPVELAEDPGLLPLRSIIEPLLAGQRMEHVAVLFEGERRDMFVGEVSSLDPFNPRATAIYHNATRVAIECGQISAASRPEPWPRIGGPAVLFPQHRVWF